MPASHKKGIARAERRQKAVARYSDIVEQPEPSIAAQQPGPDTQIPQSEPSNASIQVEGVEESGQADRGGDSVSDEPSLPALHELSQPPSGEEMGPTEQANVPTPETPESDTVPTNVVNTGGDSTGQSGTSERSRRGNINTVLPEWEVKKKRR